MKKIKKHYAKKKHSRKSVSYFSFYRLLIYASIIALVFVIAFFRNAQQNKSAQASVNANGRGFFFGSNIHTDVLPSNELDAIVAGATNAHFTMLRGGDTFANIAPVSSDTATWNWARQDAWVTKTTAAGITPMVNLLYGAPWLDANPLNSNETLVNKNAFILAFGSFAYEVANRYKPANVNNLPIVTYFNIWNESSLTIFFNWGPDEFARLFAEASYRVKQANPNAVVSFDVHAIDWMYSYNYTAENQTGSTYMPRVLSKTVTLQYNGQSVSVIDLADLLQAHSYPDRTSDIPEDILSVRKELHDPFSDINAYLTHTYVNILGQKYGYGPVRGRKRYMLTENGWYSSQSGCTPGHWVTDSKQAGLIIRTLLNVLANPLIEGYLQYDMKDDGTIPSCTSDTTEHGYGLSRYVLNPDGSLNIKPSYTAYKTTTETLNGTNFVSETKTIIDSNQKIINYKFMSSDGIKTVWALVRPNSLKPLATLDTTTTSSVTLSVSAPTVTQVNLDGSTQVLTASNSSIAVNVSENPIFIVQEGSLVPTDTPTPVQPTPTPTSIPTPTPTPKGSYFIIITTPQDGAILTGGGSIAVGPIASYTNNTKNIKIFVDGVEKKFCNYPTNSCSVWLNLAPGVHTIYATGYDKATPSNFTTSPTITVTR